MGRLNFVDKFADNKRLPIRSWPTLTTSVLKQPLSCEVGQREKWAGTCPRALGVPLPQLPATAGTHLSNCSMGRPPCKNAVKPSNGDYCRKRSAGL